MLKPGFKAKVADWVMEQYSVHPSEMEKALDEFNFSELIEGSENPDSIQGLFAEWLVFDRKGRLFKNKTGLASFTEHNPLKLSSIDLSAYRDMLQNSADFFTVKQASFSQNVTLEDMEGKEYVVHDVSASMNVKDGVLWTRIAKVSGIYQMVGSLYIPLPLTFANGFKAAASKWGGVDARSIACFIGGKISHKEPSEWQEMTDSSDGNYAQMRADLRKEFQDLLDAYGMSKMFTLDTFDSWLTDASKSKSGFATRTIYLLLPEYLNKEQVHKLIDVSMHYSNYVPRPALKGKCPTEASRENAGKQVGPIFEQDIISSEDNKDLCEHAEAMNHEKKFDDSYKGFTAAIRDLLDKKQPSVVAFRICLNAGVALINTQNLDKVYLGEQLVLAALRLNPRYIFAQKVMEEVVSKYYDFEKILRNPTKANVAKAKKFAKQDRLLAETKYARTPFKRYEDFLAKNNISLEYDTEQVTRPVFVPHTKEKPVEPKTERNTPCPCGSGKKYKKCCMK